MYQKCPICNGSGTKFIPNMPATVIDCKTCNGTGLINKLTGQPAMKQYPIVLSNFQGHISDSKAYEPCSWHEPSIDEITGIPQTYEHQEGN